MLLQPCILPYIIHFPGSRRSSRDRSMLSKPCILQYMIKFPGYWRSSRDRSMLSKTCILQYMINFPGYWRSFGDALELRGLKLELREALLMSASLIWNRSHPKPRASDQPCTLQYIIHFPGSRCCPNRVFYNILFTFPGLGGAPETARCFSTVHVTISY